MQFLCTSPLAKSILALLQNYAKCSGENNIKFSLIEDFNIYCTEVTSERLNEYRVYALGCYDALRNK